NEYAINTLYHKCTVFVSFNYIAGLLLGKSFLLLIALYIAAAYFLPYKEDRDAERYGTGPRKIKEAEKINKSWFE
ncbi:alcohol dehydrogenase, partial [Streptococcus suis]|nr:alcohol dehydrogenase [Streptococcus suis]